MELKFLGRGAAFNPKEGNNSAYFIEDKNLFLIDCGETVYKELIIKNILKDIENIYVIITHTHSDHIGSIGTLASHVYYKMNNKIKVVIPAKPDKNKYLNYIESILEATNCLNKYELISEEELDNKFKSFASIRYYETVHSNNLTCYCLVISTDNGYIYYSGDSKETSTVEKLIREEKKIDKMYFDVTLNDSEDSHHLNVNVLTKVIPNNLQDKVYCMHIDSDSLIERIEELGYKLVEEDLCQE